MNDVHQRIMKLIQDISEPTKPDFSDPSRPLIGEGFDSLDFASLLMSIEDEFGIAIEEGSVDKVGTLSGLIAFVESKI